MTLHCITNDMPDTRSCTIRDAHTANCDRETCEGCAPREATNGMLCASCWFNLEHAIDDWADWKRELGTEARAMTPDNIARAHPGPRLPIPPMQVDIDTVDRLAPNTSIAMLVAADAGAIRAVQFTRAARATIERHPRTDREKKLPNSRCPKCGQRTLVYEPTQQTGGTATVRCLNHTCSYVDDHTAFERLALIEAQCCRRCRSDEACTDHLCTCHRFAPVPEWERTAHGTFEPYNPKNPTHQELIA